MPPLSKAVTSTPHAPKGPNSKKAVASPPPRGMNPAPHSVEVHRARPGSREVGTGSQSMWGGFQPARDARRASPRRKAPNSKAAAKPPPRGMNPAPHSVEVHRARPDSREVGTGSQSMWGGFQPFQPAQSGGIATALQNYLDPRYSLKIASSTCRDTSRNPAPSNAEMIVCGGTQVRIVSQ